MLGLEGGKHGAPRPKVGTQLFVIRAEMDGGKW